jgi:hypothetical protein
LAIINTNLNPNQPNPVVINTYMNPNQPNSGQGGGAAHKKGVAYAERIARARRAVMPGGGKRGQEGKEKSCREGDYAG